MCNRQIGILQAPANFDNILLIVADLQHDKIPVLLLSDFACGGSDTVPQLHLFGGASRQKSLPEEQNAGPRRTRLRQIGEKFRTAELTALIQETTGVAFRERGPVRLPISEASLAILNFAGNYRHPSCPWHKTDKPWPKVTVSRTESDRQTFGDDAPATTSRIRSFERPLTTSGSPHRSYDHGRPSCQRLSTINPNPSRVIDGTTLRSAPR